MEGMFTEQWQLNAADSQFISIDILMFFHGVWHKSVEMPPSFWLSDDWQINTIVVIVIE